MTTEQPLLSTLSDQLANAVERAGQSTVTVKARRRIPASGTAWADGVIVTAAHVIESDENIRVVLPGGQEVAATLAGRDPGSDLAVLRVQGANLTPATLATGDPKVGQFALALGRPGESVEASFGVVSIVGGPWRTFRGGTLDAYVRTDTTFYPGFSGGPLIDSDGRVVGINSSRLGRGAGLTIPVGAAGKVVEALLKSGKIKRGYLGLGSQQARLPEALAAKLGGQETGLLVVMVEPGTPAEKAGVVIGDVLVSMAGQPLRATEDLQAILTADRVGQPTPLTVLRGGEPKDLTVTVGERN